MKRHTRNVFLLVIIFFYFGTINSFSQCKLLAKRQCFPALTPYIHNGQLNSVKLSPGGTADLQMTFYSGQSYRLMICAEGVLGDVNFRVIDTDKKEVFYSKRADKKDDIIELAKYWDFKIESTQQLIVEVEVPLSKSPNKLIPDGCVSIIVGFKGSK